MANYQGRIVVPTTHPDAGETIAEITDHMATVFGGYSVYDGIGGWKEDDGMVEEEHKRIVVNSSDMSREQFTVEMENYAQHVKQRCDEDAVLIEMVEIDMELV